MSRARAALPRPDPGTPALWALRPEQAAPLLLGWHLVAERGGQQVEVVLTEVEAYAGSTDPGSHAFRGPTRRNGSMFGPPGRAYIYFTYGMHWCANVVVHPPGEAGAVLLRAGRIVAGMGAARARRPRARSDDTLASGPARLTRALGIDGSLDGVDLNDPASPIRLLPGALVTAAASSPRTGVAGEGSTTPWRFYLPGDPTVSRYRAAAARRGST